MSKVLLAFLFVLFLALPLFAQGGDTTLANLNKEELTPNSWVCGDANGNGFTSIADVIYTINHLMGLGSPPNPLSAANVDSICGVNVADVVYLNNWIFTCGPGFGLHCKDVSPCAPPTVPGNSITVGCPPYYVYPDSDSIAIPIYISNSVPINGITIGLHYNSDSIEITSVDTSGTVLSQYIFRTNSNCDTTSNQVLIGWFGPCSYSSLAPQSGGLLAKLNAKVMVGTSIPERVNLDSTSVGPAEFLFTPYSGGLLRPEFYDCGSGSDSGAIAGLVKDAPTQQNLGAVLVQAQQGGIVKGSGITDSSGQYSIVNLLPGVYDVRASKECYKTGTSPAETVIAGLTTTVNFSLTPDTSCGVDVWVELYGSRPDAIRGYNKKYKIYYGNDRMEKAENVVLSVQMPPEVIYHSCGDLPCVYDGQKVTWNLGTVLCCLWGLVWVEFEVPASLEPGTVLKGIAKITTTSGDIDLRNNVSEEYEIVSTSWDPNDKDAQPWGGGTPKYIMPCQPLRHSIFFANDTSATAEAIDIDVIDTLDANLDWSTLQIGPMSHPDTCQASFDTLTGVLSWHCDSIMLPPDHNPPEGEGFVTFSVKPKSELAFGTQIKNRAYIKFDFNPWIAAPGTGPVIRTIGLYGDANSDGKLNVTDVIYLVNYLFKGGPEPNPLLAADVNCDAKINVTDVIYLINYLFKGGPPPAC